MVVEEPPPATRRPCVQLRYVVRTHMRPCVYMYVHPLSRRWQTHHRKRQVVGPPAEGMGGKRRPAASHPRSRKEIQPLQGWPMREQGARGLGKPRLQTAPVTPTRGLSPSGAHTCALAYVRIYVRTCMRCLVNGRPTTANGRWWARQRTGWAASGGRLQAIRDRGGKFSNFITVPRERPLPPAPPGPARR